MLRIRFYNLGQYPQEEQWLHEMAAQGWIIQKSVLPCFYFFQKEKPQDIVYRFDFLPCVRQQDDSINLFEDYGWKYITQMNDFVLFANRQKTFPIQIWRSSLRLNQKRNDHADSEKQTDSSQFRFRFHDTFMHIHMGLWSLMGFKGDHNGMYWNRFCRGSKLLD